MPTPSGPPREDQSRSRGDEQAPEHRATDGRGEETLAEKIRRYRQPGPADGAGTSRGGESRERSRDLAE